MHFRSSEIHFGHISMCVIAVAVLFFSYEKAPYAYAQEVLGASTGASNASAEELRRKIEEQAKNIEALNTEIKAYSELKDKTTAEAKTLQAAIKELDNNAKRLDLDIKKTTSQIDKASLEINSLDLGIKSSEEKIIDYQVTLRQSLQQVQQAEDINIIETLLSGESMSDALARINNRINFNASLNRLLNSLHSEKKSLETSKVAKEDKKEELKDFQNQLSDKKKVVEVNKTERSKILTETKNQEKVYQSLLAEKQAKKAAFEKELFAYESALKYTLDPSSIPKSGSTVFSWPLDNVIITQRFGKTVAAKRLYVSGSHNGVDFGAKMGTAVKAMLNGKVVGTGDTDITCPRASFGRWVLIEYPNGLTAIFAHLSVISVKQGDVVAQGQIVGYSGNTGYSTGPHLHVSLYASNAVKVENRPSASCSGKTYTMPIAPVDAYLDVLQYLPKI
jgi:murein DD-endopeptidase MepM/ murein hydrolase activator NlpD